MRGLRQDGLAYRGVLYIGLMVTANGPRVLEFNVRLGDPETQVLLPLLDCDLAELLEALAAGRLQRVAPPPRRPARSGVTVIAAARGYPGAYETRPGGGVLAPSPVPRARCSMPAPTAAAACSGPAAAAVSP